MSRLTHDYSSGELRTLDSRAHELVRDLHRAKPVVYWTDLLVSGTVGWTAFAASVTAPALSVSWLGVTVIAVVALYRCLCFTHEITHLRRGMVPGFETVWNLGVGIPLLLPTFAYVGVHQVHHAPSTYGTPEDPEYLPFARSRALLWGFAVQAALVFPLLLLLRFLVLAPIGLLIPRFHRWLEAHASSFSMNPRYRRHLSDLERARMRRWELTVLALWGCGQAGGLVTTALLVQWLVVVIAISFLNTLRVLGAHEYDSDGQILSRHEQLADSIDTPGGPWTELWAPVGLRYHALHHYFPGIPYHSLGEAYRRIAGDEACHRPYREQTRRGLWQALAALHRRAGMASAAVRHSLGRWA